MTALTVFDAPTHVVYGGHRVRGVVVPCGYCGAVENVPVNTFAGSNKGRPSAEVEAQFIKRKLENMNWLIGKKYGGHRCPKCYAAIKATAARRAGEARVAAKTVRQTAR